MIDAYASQPHYIDHIAPVWEALPPEERGLFRIPPDRALRECCQSAGIEPRWDGPAAKRPCIIAGGSDLRQVWPGLGILIEHGAGQTYRGLDHPSWAGSSQRSRARLFIVPNESVAEAQEAHSRDARFCIASPRLEHLASLQRSWQHPAEGPGIVFTGHWDCLMEGVPELRAALPEWQGAILSCAERAPEIPIAMHAHPRAQQQIGRWAHACGLPFIREFKLLIDWKPETILAFDNSSAGFEWAALGRPCICLNSKHYRIDIEHGLRFWGMAPGPWIFPKPTPEAGADEILAAIEDASSPDWQRRRAEISAAVFPNIEGSAERAAEAILEAF